MSKNIEHSRAVSHLTISGAAAIDEQIKELARLLHLTGARLEASLCTGKYRGTCDYSVVYDGGQLSIANINNSRSKGDVTDRVMCALTETLSEYKTLFANKAAVWEALKERERSDNARAAEMGLKQYLLKRLGIATHGGHCGWAYIVLEIDGKERLHTETGLKYALTRCKLDELRGIRENYYSACNYKDDEVDFIQGGVGFVFSSSGYTVEHEGVTIIEEAS